MSPKRKPVTAARLASAVEDWLGTPARSEQGVVRLVEAGLPTAIVNRLMERGLSKDEVFHIVVNPRTLKHRKSANQPLSREESERAVRAARILARAESVWGGQDAALRWLREPKRRFEGRSPLDMLSTETGGRLVEEMLIQIDEGMFA
jgi:putative toxin-antitoxin system antitoxin component (TIGR02293 family)